MIQIDENINLKPFNTFRIEAFARYFIKISDEHELQELIQSDLYRHKKHLILGGGSNMLFTKDFDGLVIKIAIKGIETVHETDESITLRVGGGVLWHDFVMHCVRNNWGGVENMSLIPGVIGASPIQNIGAYGVEVKDVIQKVEVIDLFTGASRSFTNEECHFGYRESVFKHELKEKYFISSVTLTLSKENHRLNIGYGAIQDTLKMMNITHPTIQAVSDAVIHIRKSKLPDPDVIGNAGSFFKNPTITLEHYHSLQKLYSEAPGYHSANQEVKIPAGWLIEQCGWKGKTFHNIGVHAHQALVLVNYGGGSGDEIYTLAKNIQASVKEKFDISLSTEVNIIS